MAYRKRKEAGKVSHSVAMQHTGAVRILTQPIIEGIHYGIDHLPRVRRHGFGQSNCLRSLRVSPSQWDHGARVSRWRGYPRSTFLHRMRGACCCFECTRSGSACATSASSCPADSTRAAPQKNKRNPRSSNVQAADPRLSLQESVAIRLYGASWAPAAP